MQSEGLKSEKWHNCQSRGQPALCSEAVLEEAQAEQGCQSTVLSTDVTLAPCAASAACASKGARAGHS